MFEQLSNIERALQVARNAHPEDDFSLITNGTEYFWITIKGGGGFGVPEMYKLNKKTGDISEVSMLEYWELSNKDSFRVELDGYECYKVNGSNVSGPIIM